MDCTGVLSLAEANQLSLHFEIVIVKRCRSRIWVIQAAVLRVHRPLHLPLPLPIIFVQFFLVPTLFCSNAKTCTRLYGVLIVRHTTSEPMTYADMLWSVKGIDSVRITGRRVGGFDPTRCIQPPSWTYLFFGGQIMPVRQCVMQGLSLYHLDW